MQRHQTGEPEVLSKRPAFSARGAIVLVMSMGILSMDACARGAHDPRIDEQPNHRYVILERRAGAQPPEMSDGSVYRPPIAESSWERILGDIYVRPRKSFFSMGKGDSELVPAFIEDDRHYLAKSLSEAFLKAGPQEIALFYLSHGRESGVTEITSGGWYLRDSQIRLIMANYRQAVTMAFIEQKIRIDPLRSAGHSFYDIVPLPHQVLQTGRGSLNMLFPKVPELIIDSRAFPSHAAESMPAGEGRISEGTLDYDRQLENRLRTLDQLRKQGLITNEEYHRKRQQLLDEL